MDYVDHKTLNSTEEKDSTLDYIIKDEQLKLIYEPGKGAWTYHLRIPNTKDIKGKWGNIKVSGFIDNYKIDAKNLAPTKGEDKLLSINSTIRKAINKGAGDYVKVTLYLLSSIVALDKKQIMATFEDAGVLKFFERLPEGEKHKILEDILIQNSEEAQVKTIIKYIDNFN